MIRHKFPIGDHAPDTVQMVVEIPRAHAMAIKTEVDFATGELLNKGRSIDPAIPIYWHYGAIPETVGNDGEPVDILVLGEGLRPNPGDSIDVRPIGVYKVMDGWQTSDDKIIAVPDTPEFRHITEIEDLPEITTYGGTSKSFPDLMEEFASQYRTEDEIIYNGWGDSDEAKKVIELGMRRYDCIPLAADRESEHVFPLHQLIFLPPPPKYLSSTTYIGDVLQEQGLLEGSIEDEDYGHIVSNDTVRQALQDTCQSHISTSALNSIDREELIKEKLQIADMLKKHGAQVFTASNDKTWLERAAEHGVACHYVEQDAYDVENIAGLSKQYISTVHYRKTDGTHVAIGMGIKDAREVKALLMKSGAIEEADECTVISAPEQLIPWGVPTSDGTKITQLVNWTDYGFNIWPDKQNRPHLVISDTVRKMAKAKGQMEELEEFLTKCQEHFQGVHFLELAEGELYGAPTNSIDVGMAIITPGSLSERSRQEMERILQRPIDNSVHLAEHTKNGEPGLRCGLFPVDKVAYSLLIEGDPLHHISAERIEYAPLRTFHDLDSDDHAQFKAKVDEVRRKAGYPFPVDNVTRRVQPTTKEVAVIPKSDVAPELAQANELPEQRERG